jgi:hypothetical protein
MSVISFTGIFLVFLMFSKSLSPTRNAKVMAAHRGSLIFEVPEFEETSEKFIETYKGPLLIRKIGVDNYLIMYFVAEFSDPAVHGCSIKTLSKGENNLDSFPKNTAYYEMCRGVKYDHDGNVLEFSHPSALPIRRLNWGFKDNGTKQIEIYP